MLVDPGILALVRKGECTRDKSVMASNLKPTAGLDLLAAVPLVFAPADLFAVRLPDAVLRPVRLVSMVGLGRRGVGVHRNTTPSRPHAARSRRARFARSVKTSIPARLTPGRRRRRLSCRALLAMDQGTTRQQDDDDNAQKKSTCRCNFGVQVPRPLFYDSQKKKHDSCTYLDLHLGVYRFGMIIAYLFFGPRCNLYACITLFHVG
jgi:hypothetical protein